MKKLIFLSIFLFLSLFCQAQTYQFKTEALAVRLYSHVEKTFGEWEEWKPCVVLVSLSLDSGKMTIDSEFVQEYTILSSELINIEETKVLIFECIDSLGGRCIIQMFYLKENDIHHMYIKWRTLQIVYQMRKL